MVRQLDPLLVELFESVHRALARTLEDVERSRSGEPTGPDALVRLQRITRLSATLASLKGALEQREGRMIH